MNMNYNQFMDYSKQHYEKGGDTYFECWDEKTFYQFYPNGITKKASRELFAKNLDHENDVAGYWRY